MPEIDIIQNIKRKCWDKEVIPHESILFDDKQSKDGQFVNNNNN